MCACWDTVMYHGHPCTVEAVWEGWVLLRPGDISGGTYIVREEEIEDILL